MDDEELIPPKFWKTLSADEMKVVFATGYLNADLCARLWRMQDRQTAPPQRAEVLVDREAVDRLRPAKKERR